MGIIVLIVVGVILLGVLKVDLRNIFTRPEVAKNLSFVREKALTMWIAAEPVRYFTVRAFDTYIRKPLERAESATSTTTL